MLIEKPIAINFFNTENSENALNFNFNGVEPVVTWFQKEFKDLKELTRTLPFLLDPKNAQILAETTLFLKNQWTNYRLIDNIETFKKSYLAKMEKNGNYCPLHTLSLIKKPEVIDHNCIFFVEHLVNHLPYKITCHFPRTVSKLEVEIILL